MSAIQPNYDFDDERQEHPDYAKLAQSKMLETYQRLQQQPATPEELVRARAYADPEIRKRWLKFGS